MILENDLNLWSWGVAGFPRRGGSGEAAGFAAWGRLPPHDYILLNWEIFFKFGINII